MPLFGLGAAAALLLGAVVYAAMRDHVPAAVPQWLAAAQPLGALRAVVPDTLTGPLPSFAHAIAILLLTAMAAGRGALALPATAASTALCLVLEIVQHPVVADSLAAGAWPDWLASYAVHGTFSRGDVAAILLASLAVFALMTLRRRDATVTNRDH